MAATVVFKDWLDEKLRELNTDENIFGSYIQSILDGDDSSEEKNEALQAIISEIVENDVEITKLCEEILNKWCLHQPKEPPPATPSSEDINDKLAKLLECQLPTTKQKQYTAEEKKIREAILSQYSEMTDSEGEETEGGDTSIVKEKASTAAAKEKTGGIEKNVNAQLVADAEKQKREHAKQESQKKKEKDREDREKQKNLKEEKKEKRKTQKGERRR